MPVSMKEKILLPHFVLFPLKEDKGQAKSGLRIIVTKKIKRAVDRNRIKRVVRESFRKRGLLPWPGVVCKIRPTAAQAKNDELFQELDSALSNPPLSSYRG